MERISDFVGDNNITVAETMQRINQNTHGILFLINEKKQLEASVTDGDIRRFIISGGKVSDNVSKAANKEPKTALNIEEAKALFHRLNYKVIPILDEEKRIIDIYYGKSEFKERKKVCLNIPVVINAGGRGTRLDPYTRVLPKPLIPVGDRPIIEHIIEEYRGYGSADFHIIVNYKKELIKAFFNGENQEYDIRWYDEEIPLGTGGGLSFLKGSLNETFFFTNCDVLLKSDYGNILRYHRDNNNTITMVCAKKKYYIPYGVVEVKEDGLLDRINEKPEISYLSNTGIYIVEPQVLDDLQENVAMGFPEIIEEQKDMGRRIGIYAIEDEEWMDMGQMPELENMRKRLYGE